MTEVEVRDCYREALIEAARLLKELSVFCGRAPAFSGLNGWVFEKTIQKCIRDSLTSRGASLPIDEQFTLGGRMKADLKVGSFVIEIKSAGLFGQLDMTKYRKYQSVARGLGLRFILLSLYESHQPFRTGIADALGPENVFLLREEAGSWQRFIDLLVSEAEGRDNGMREPKTRV